jgi:endonuclease YncB( thermonuclease family)
MPVATTLACLVIAIADGDTLTARCEVPAGHQNIIVRLAEIDAPEKRQSFGQRSRQHLAELCFGKQARVVIQNVDRYGRSVARVTCAGTDANAEQVRAGLAWAYAAYVTDSHITELERNARQSKRGLWTAQSPVPPWEWRRASSISTVSCDGPPPWPSRCHSGTSP